MVDRLVVVFVCLFAFFEKTRKNLFMFHYWIYLPEVKLQIQILISRTAVECCFCLFCFLWMNSERGMCT